MKRQKGLKRLAKLAKLFSLFTAGCFFCRSFMIPGHEHALKNESIDQHTAEADELAIFLTTIIINAKYIDTAISICVNQSPPPP